LSVDSGLIKSWPLGSDGAAVGETIFRCSLLGRKNPDNSSPEPASKFQSKLVQIILGLREFKFSK
jgi:hypothetical protein